MQGKANDIKRRLLADKQERTFLLKRGQETKRFVIIYEFSGQHYVRYSDWRQQMEFSRATNDADFPDLIAQASHIGHGVPVGAGQAVDVYGIDPSRRDVVPPTGDNAFWKVYATREPKERFEIVGAESIYTGGYWEESEW